MFTLDDAQDIMQIMVGGVSKEDHLAWNFTKDGQFNVKSAYHLRMAMNRMKGGQPGPSSTVANHRGWLSLWDTGAPNKAKIHTWRLMRNGLAVGLNYFIAGLRQAFFVLHVEEKRSCIIGSGSVRIQPYFGKFCTQN